MTIAICYVGCEETGVQSYLTQQAADKVEQTDFLMKAKGTAMGKRAKRATNQNMKSASRNTWECSVFK